MRRPAISRSTLVVGGLVLVAAIVPQGLNDYTLFLAATVFTYAMIAMGLNLVLGWTGQFAFIDVAFFGIGSYVGARIGSVLELPLELALLVGIAAGLVVGLGFGALVSRLRRYYLSIVTIAFMFVLVYVYENATSLTGGLAGFTVPDPQLLVLGGLEISGEYGLYYIGLTLLVATYAFVTWLGRTQLARGWRTLRMSEDVAASLGVDVYRSKVIAIAVAGGILGLAGAWFPYVTGSVFPSSYGFPQLLFDFLVVVVGGLGSMRGAVIAAIALGVVNEKLRGLIGVSEIAFGVVLLACVMFLRRGVYGELAARVPEMREKVI